MSVRERKRWAKAVRHVVTNVYGQHPDDVLFLGAADRWLREALEAFEAAGYVLAVRRKPDA